MASEPIEWTPDGLRVALRPAPASRVAVTLRLGALMVIGLAVILGSAPWWIGERDVPEPLPDLPAPCLDAPWDCPVDAGGAPTDAPYTRGLRPEAFQAVATEVALGRTLGDPPVSGLVGCVDMFRGTAQGMGQAELDCVNRVAKGVETGALVVPSEPAPVVLRGAVHFRELWERTLRREFAGQRAKIEAKRAAKIASAEAFAAAEASFARGLAFAGALLGALAVAMGLGSLRGSRPVRVALDARGLVVGNRAFARTDITSVQVGRVVRVRTRDGRTWESARIALADRPELTAALEQLVLGDDALIAEQRGRAEATAALAAARPRERA